MLPFTLRVAYANENEFLSRKSIAPKSHAMVITFGRVGNGRCVMVVGD